MDKKTVSVIILFILIFIVAITLSVVSYNGKYSVYFETGTNDVFLTRYVSKNNKVAEPSIPQKEGYIFKEWQLNGKKYDFNTKIKSDTVLTAKWVKEEYVLVNFDTTTEEKVESIKILKGEVLKELPVINKENYKFIGWTLNDKLYDNEEVYSDITLVAKFEHNKINSNYKIDDVVEIAGSYANSAYSSTCDNSIAIGWERRIIKIFEDGEYPYAVGDERGITGYFKAESLKVK